jgi:hypothetical protein
VNVEAGGGQGLLHTELKLLVRSGRRKHRDDPACSILDRPDRGEPDPNVIH